MSTHDTLSNTEAALLASIRNHRGQSFGLHAGKGTALMALRDSGMIEWRDRDCENLFTGWYPTCAALASQQEHNPFLDMPIDRCDFSVRIRSALRHWGVNTLGDLADKKEWDLRNRKNVGETSLQQVKDALTRVGLSLKPEPQPCPWPDLPASEQSPPREQQPPAIPPHAAPD